VGYTAAIQPVGNFNKIELIITVGNHIDLNFYLGGLGGGGGEGNSILTDGGSGAVG
jgi:hypothetical protein